MTQRRIHEVPEAPIFYPTDEEFADPLKYIQTIRPIAEKSGICKIIPPVDWKPPFALDIQHFRFKTRVQRLNALEGRTRLAVNFVEGLFRYWCSQGKPIGKLPRIDKKPLDLYKLKREVDLRGGYKQVCEKRLWVEAGRAMGLSNRSCTGLSHLLRQHYEKYISPYDQFLEKMKRKRSEKGGSNPRPAHNDRYGYKRARVDKDMLKRIDVDIKIEYEKEDENSEQSKSNEVNEACEICKRSHEPDKILLCDDCDLGFHMFCLDPPLLNIPSDDWYCAECSSKPEEYAFEEGDEHSLASFKEMADTFKRKWFIGRSKSVDNLVEEDIEREFWRLVESPFETVEVEYGADLHSSKHGSGFPSMEHDPMNDYAHCGWNLKNLALLPDSLFRFIKSDISGMMVPWLYVGMLFSSFCWHNEDHYTYSINYLHWGSTKTWYGISAEDAEKFESTMKNTVPELFEYQPDLLLHLVTLLSPVRLLDSKVKVSKVNQRSGEFVVTFPQAYHSGFNQGVNFAEAVNFATPDWFSYGRKCVERYRLYRRYNVFSHDELLYSIAKGEISIELAIAIKDDVVDMCQKELMLRNQLRSNGLILEKSITSNAVSEDEFTCSVCNWTCFLSIIGCKCSTQKCCMEHVADLCACSIDDKALILRVSDMDLDALLNHIVSLAMAPQVWQRKLVSTLQQYAIPPLKLLQQLLVEGERLAYKFPELTDLERFVTIAISLIENINTTLMKKHQTRRQSTETIHETKPIERSTLDKARDLLREVRRLSFISPEVTLLEKTVDYSSDLEHRIHHVLNSVHTKTSDLRDYYVQCQSMIVKIPSEDELQKRIALIDWEERATSALENRISLSYSDLKSIVFDAAKLFISPENSLFVRMNQLLVKSDQWIAICAELISNPNDADKFNALLSEIDNVVYDPAMLDLLKKAFSHSKNWTVQAELYLNDPLKQYDPKEIRKFLDQGLQVKGPYQVLARFQAILLDIDLWYTEIKSIFNARRLNTRSAEEILHEILTAVEANCMLHGVNSNPMHICFCGLADGGFMVLCDQCKVWYHGRCLNLTRKEIENEDKYFCPFCDLTKEVPHWSRRPNLKRLEILLQSASYNASKTKAYNLLQTIVTRISDWRVMIVKFMGQLNGDVGAIRNLLFKAESMEVICDELYTLRQLLADGSSNLSQPKNKENNIYCHCRQPYHEDGSDGPMVCCDTCDEWYHLKCIHVHPSAVSNMKYFMCRTCCAERNTKYRFDDIINAFDTIKPVTSLLSSLPEETPSKEMANGTEHPLQSTDQFTIP